MSSPFTCSKCFGYDGVDNGHNRVPDPPAISTAIMSTFSLAANRPDGEAVIVTICYTASYMKIAIIGPTHPYKGGIAQHTTELAHRLTHAGNDVEIVSWRNQYPFFYPGVQFVPDDKPELEPFPGT